MASYWLASFPVAGMVYFSAHHDAARPDDVHLCRVPLAGGEVQRLTPHEGVHEILMFKPCDFDPARSYPARRTPRLWRAAGGLFHRQTRAALRCRIEGGPGARAVIGGTAAHRFTVG